MIEPHLIKTFVENEWNTNILPSLSEYIKIPNKSPHFDEKWQEHGFMEQAVQHIAAWCKAQKVEGMTLEIIRLPERTPLLWIEIAGNSEDTILMYGHLDKQPEMTGWHEDLGPWQPVLKDGKLYGRGGADDGYSAYAALTAVRALQEQGLQHGRIIILIEACEESGSYDLPYYIDLLKDRILYPHLIICLDSGAGNYEQLWVTTSLRGNVVGALSVALLQEGVHSGVASGIVADSFRIAKHLISRIEDEQSGNILLKGLHTEIPDYRVQEAGHCAAALGNTVYTSLPLYPKVVPVTEDVQALLLNRTWRPALAVTGADGLPHIPDAGNVLRAKTVLKLSMRLPPTLCPQYAASLMHDALTERPPYGAAVQFDILDTAKGWQAPPLTDWLLHTVDSASQCFFQKPAQYMGEGGTIPFMSLLGERFPEAQFVITGVLGPHSNAHGPNEFLHLDMAANITSCVAYIIHSFFEEKILS